MDSDKLFENININDVCRACFEKCGHYKFLFDAAENIANRTLGDIFFDVVKIEVSTNPHTPPNRICLTCSYDLVNAYNFIQNSQKNNERLMTFLKNPNVKQTDCLTEFKIDNSHDEDIADTFEIKIEKETLQDNNYSMLMEYKNSSVNSFGSEGSDYEAQAKKTLKVPKLECTYCNQIFKKQNLYENHMRIHTEGDVKKKEESEDGSKFECYECDFNCHSDLELEKHQQSEHTSPSLVPNNNGAHNLDYKGYLYLGSKSYSSNNGLVKYWICQHKSKNDPLMGKKRIQVCSAVLHTLEIDGHLKIKKEPNEHTCTLVSGVQRRRDKLRMELRCYAETSTESPSVIIENFKRTKTADELKDMPKHVALLKCIQRLKKRNQPIVPVEMELSADILQGEMKKTISGADFLRTGIIQDGCHSLIFATDQDLITLQQSQFWIMEGTFQTAPNMPYQLFTIHATVGASEEYFEMAPLVYILMDSNLQNAYEDVFVYIASQMKNIQARFMVCDFEIAAINALQSVFPTIPPVGCYFHLKQAFFRHLKTCGLEEIYMNNSVFAKYVNMLGALAFLSAPEILSGFEEVKAKLLQKFHREREKLDEFLRYISVLYVFGRPRGVLKNENLRFDAPNFPPSSWTVSERTNLGLPRISKSLEAWNNRWKRFLVKKQLGMHKCVEELRKEQHAVSSNLQSNFELKRKKKFGKESSLKEFLNLRFQMSMLEFLESLALRLEEVQ